MKLKNLSKISLAVAAASAAGIIARNQARSVTPGENSSSTPLASAQNLPKEPLATPAAPAAKTAAPAAPAAKTAAHGSENHSGALRGNTPEERARMREKLARLNRTAQERALQSSELASAARNYKAALEKAEAMRKAALAKTKDVRELANPSPEIERAIEQANALERDAQRAWIARAGRSGLTLETTH